MIITVQGHTLRISFYYTPTMDGLPRFSSAGIFKLVDSEKDLWTPMLEGRASCSKDDQFNRRTGRRLALTRALKGLPRDFRKEVWSALLEKGMKP